MLYIKEFLKSPNDNTPFVNHSVKVNLAISIVWFLFGIVFAAIIQVIVKFTMESFDVFFNIEEFNYALSSAKEELGILKYMIIAVIIGPVYEEFIFRYGLSFKKNDVIISLSLVISVFFVSYTEAFTNPTSLIFPIILFLSAYFILKKSISNTMLENIRSKHSRSIIYLSATLFALVHFINIESFSFVLMPYYIAAVLPIFNLALVSSFLRINLGIIYSIGFHITWNLLVTIFTI